MCIWSVCIIMTNKNSNTFPVSDKTVKNLWETHSYWNYKLDNWNSISVHYIFAEMYVVCMWSVLSYGTKPSDKKKKTLNNNNGIKSFLYCFWQYRQWCSEYCCSQVVSSILSSGYCLWQVLRVLHICFLRVLWFQHTNTFCYASKWIG